MTGVPYALPMDSSQGRFVPGTPAGDCWIWLVANVAIKAPAENAVRYLIVFMISLTLVYGI